MVQTKLSMKKIRLVEHVLLGMGYDLEDNSLDSDGRLTMSHGDDADSKFMRMCCKRLAEIGFVREGVFVFKDDAGGIIELEPGGSETTGHLVHWMTHG